MPRAGAALVVGGIYVVPPLSKVVQNAFTEFSQMDQEALRQEQRTLDRLEDVRSKVCGRASGIFRQVDV